MERSNFVIEVLRLSLFFFFIILFLINVLRINNIEERIINNAGRTESLVDTAKELRVILDRLSLMIEPAISADDRDTPVREWLHPEVENFLIPEMDIAFTPPEGKTEGTLIRHYGTNPQGFNPLTINNANIFLYLKNYCLDSFAGRHRSNPDLWKPALAERIEITDDYKEYTIYLKKGIRWHKPVVDWSNPRYEWLKGVHYVTAKDVKFTIDLIQNPQVDCASLRDYYKDLRV